MPRARPLPAEERRREIVSAALPLFEEVGFDASTRQIACAAGVAEGTLYRVFPTKRHILAHVAEGFFDPQRLVDGLTAIDPAVNVEERLDRINGVLLASSGRLHAFMAAFHRTGYPANRRAFKDGAAQEAVKRSHDLIEQKQSDIINAIVRLLAPDADRLTVPVSTAAAYLCCLAWGGGVWPVARGELRDPAVVGILVRGALLRTAPAAQASG
ncbi:MAG: TetR/AcrR family transcriptional regulator [Propionibacteriaceae bacterium]|jgi:AcrR family transcriptional regulator|nr:TetR/AcrR family transcriptional regulator [Propionibacteriaceae bacterium]